MRFTIPPATLAKLRAVASTERAHVFLLDPGMGPVICLTADGRVLVDGGGFWDDLPEHEASDDEAVAAIVVGAKKTGIVELLELLPPPAAGSRPCATCAGTRWQRFTPELVVICSQCYGRGWLLPAPTE